jgi:SAM-dependent methyltransferase
MAYASGDYDGEGVLSLSSLVYQRIQGLASRISERFPNQRVRVLDVGGGEGFLSLFLRRCDYALAEPSVNGLLVTHFPERSFDVVAACHVFEHIPTDQKDVFLKQMCSVARRQVLLLGPMETGAHHPADATPLIYKITKAPWAREHIECGVPSLDVITRWAAEHDIPCRVSPRGNRMSAYWAVFADYFAACAEKTEELREVERFANRCLRTDIVNAADPNEYMIEFDLERRGSPT